MRNQVQRASARTSGATRTYREHWGTRTTLRLDHSGCSSSVARSCVSHLESKKVGWVLSSSEREGSRSEGAVVGDDVERSVVFKKDRLQALRRKRTTEETKKMAEEPPRTSQDGRWINEIARRVRRVNRVGA